jgi:hypothetical protein
MKLKIELSAPGHVKGGYSLTGRIVVKVKSQQKFRSLAVSLVGGGGGVGLENDFTWRRRSR